MKRAGEKRRGGYIALISAIVMTAVMSLIVVTVSTSSFFSRTNVAMSYFKEKSRALSEACVQTALLRLTEDSKYPGEETIPVGSESCTLLPVVSAGATKIIQAKGVFQDAFTNLKVTVDSDDLSLVSWEEIRRF